MASVTDPAQVLTKSANQTRTIFGPAYFAPFTASQDNISYRHKARVEYGSVKELPATIEAKMTAAGKKRRLNGPTTSSSTSTPNPVPNSQALVPAAKQNGAPNSQQTPLATSLIRRDAIREEKPDWAPPWRLYRVLSGHLGWVRALAVEPDNQWFATGAGDRTIKIWDLASGTLRLTLTGHISTVRGLAVSPRHPYLFSCGEDKMVKCWDLETNKVIRHYHGHLSGVYTLDLHPTLDVLVTGGRDGVARVWDMRTRSNIHVLSGHKQTVSSVKAQEADPQIISSSLDSTVRLWDLAAGKCSGVLTHHKKGVRGLCLPPHEFTFGSCSTASIKQWKCPEGQLMQNFDGHNTVLNTISVNEDGLLMSGGDDGSMCFWDWKTGYLRQRMESVAQPGSLDAEAGIMSSTFDQTGTRLITGEADKTIKLWKPDENATEESHPLEWTPVIRRRKI
ncbi:MAG: hypothetical protein Q9162_002173 [Coniocarpon cinnabarinum]